jgi:hypothetical protein
MLISAQQMWDDLSRHHNGTALELVEFEDTQISCDGVKGVDLFWNSSGHDACDPL